MRALVSPVGRGEPRGSAALRDKGYPFPGSGPHYPGYTRVRIHPSPSFVHNDKRFGTWARLIAARFFVRKVFCEIMKAEFFFSFFYDYRDSGGIL